jgi:hypothetical protein
MSLSLVSVFYPVVAIATLWLVLLWSVRLKPSRHTRIVKGLIGVATVGLLFVPLGGLPLWAWAFSIFPNPSLPLLGIVCAGLWHRLLGIPIFKPADWRAIWMFGAVAGTVLYLHPVIWSAIDPYYWGWHRESAVWFLAVPAVALLMWGSRLGVLFLAALIAFATNALESHNGWDYVMDPLYWLISLVVLSKHVLAWACRPLWAWFQSRLREPALATTAGSAVAVDVSGVESPTQLER